MSAAMARRVRLFLLTVAAAGLTTGLGAAAAASPRTARVGASPKAPAGSHEAGSLPSTTSLSVVVALKPRDPAALASYATAVSTPGSSVYHRYLTVPQFRQEFGPTAQQVRSVESALTSAGLRPGRVSGNGLTIPVAATAGRLSRAFSIGFRRVLLPSGRSAFSNTAAPRFSGSIAGLIDGVVGLNDLDVPHPLHVASREISRDARAAAAPHVATGGPQPCAAASDAAPDWDAYTADQIASAYQFSSLYGAGDEGAGQTVALFELEPNETSDISAYQSCYGTTATVNYLKEDGGAGSGSGSGEAALDIEDVIGLAPKATIDVFQAPDSDTGLIDNYTAIVDADTDVVSTSWGLCESESGSNILSEENVLFEEAASQGQSVFAAAGDDGSTDCGTRTVAVDDPSSQPYVTGVGGTTMTSISPAPTQKVWNESTNRAGAGGGGVSSVWKMASYQSSAPAGLNVINSGSSGSPCDASRGTYCREDPDVSADADPYTGYLIYYEGSWTGIGGTSAAAPLWAAFTALVNASSACDGKPIGFANPLLYAAAASHEASDFSDITSGNNDYTPSGYRGGLYTAGAGYDEASGLGTPVGSTLPAALCGAGGSTQANQVAVTNPGAQSTTSGSSVELQMSATDSGGASLTYAATGLPAGLSISASGLVSGTPTSPGTSTVTVTATDSTGASGSTTFSWTVNAQASTVTVTNPGPQSSALNQAVRLQLSAQDSGGKSLKFTASGLPTGLSISTTGLISGESRTTGTFTVTVTATDSTGASGHASFTWTIRSTSKGGF